MQKTAPFPDPGLPWSIVYEGVLELSGYEGYREKAYQCDAGHWTCGRGETDGVTPTTVWTREYIDQRFCDSVAERSTAVLAACKVPPTENELAALTSFAYNYKDWKTSTVLKCHNRGDKMAAARAFDLVNKFTNPHTGQLEVSSGLTARRKKEAARYLTLAEGTHAMPQAVTPETSLATSPIAQVSAAGGALSTAKVLGDGVDAFKGPMDTARSFLTDWFHTSPEQAALGVIAVLFVIVIYQRFSQRRGGWA